MMLSGLMAALSGCDSAGITPGLSRDAPTTLERGEEHFYRVLWTNGRPVIRVAFGAEGIIQDYERSSANSCSSNFGNGAKADILGE